MTPSTETILVVDDNETNRILAKETLEDEGYGVLLATSGQEALDVVASARVDCVLLDVRMPGMDGIAVCEALRKSERGATVPVVFLTALRDIDTFDRAIAAGGDDFLTKPVMPSELLVRVRLALHVRRLGAERDELVMSLRKQRDDLLRVQLQKERLSAFLVHDLKNPVATIDLIAQLLAREPNLSEGARASAQQIRGEARKLSRMIMNLLDLSRADEGKLVLDRRAVDVRALLDEVVDELGVTASDREVRLRAEAAGVEGNVDRELVRRLVANLVENAIRHAPSGTEVVASATRDAEWLELHVRDAGAGVPESERARIFGAFVRAEGGEKATQGRGLGLAFCKLVAETHGGEIRVEDAAPGARFVVRLRDA